MSESNTPMFPNFNIIKLVLSDGTPYPYKPKGDMKSTGRFQEGSILDMEARECLHDIYRLRRHISGEEPLVEYPYTSDRRSAETILEDRLERLARLLDDPGWVTHPTCDGTTTCKWCIDRGYIDRGSEVVRARHSKIGENDTPLQAAARAAAREREAIAADTIDWVGAMV